mgnify:CR=1 FL=1
MTWRRNRVQEHVLAPGGFGRHVLLADGIQKVRGSNPLGSTTLSGVLNANLKPRR